MSFESDLKKIDHRTWNDIKGKWLSYIPVYPYPGAAPLYQISEFPGIEEIYSQAKKNEGYRSDIPNLRSDILREGVYFAHKAIHVCGSAIVHLDNGILSWGISSAYQSCFFSVKAFLCIMGLSFPQIGMKNMMIDCFPEDPAMSRSQLKKYGPRTELKFLVLDSLNHKHFWQILLRVLRTTNLEAANESFKALLISVDADDFSKQRNSIHYKNNYWLFEEDLFKRIFNDGFAIKENLLDQVDSNFLKPSEDDSTFLLSYILLKLNLNLINDLAKYSSSITDEYKLMQKTLNEGIHSRLHSSIQLFED